MQRLVEALTASINPTLLTRRIAEQTCLFSPKASGAAVSICTPDDCLAVVSAHGAAASQLGRVVPREGTFEARALQSRRPEVVDDAYDDPRLQPAVRTLALDLDIRSWVAIPLYHNDAAIGALSVVATAPFAFDALDINAISSLSRLVSALIGSHSELSRLLEDLFNDTDHTSHRPSTARFLAALMIPERADQNHLHDRLDTMLAAGTLQPVFQPIVDLRTRDIVALEALCRFPGTGEDDVAQWFSNARGLGRGIDLEVRALETIIDASGEIPRRMPVAVNLSPAAASHHHVQRLLMTCDRDMVVEITEHEPFPDDLGKALEPLRRNGIKIAIDDAGAGYANLNQILRLRPDIVKIDGELTTGIENDPVRRALTFSIVRLAQELGARTIAEAVENDAQQYVITRLGINYGQGFHFGRPGAAHELLPLLAADCPV